MSDPLKGKYRKHYAQEFNLAATALSNHGGELEWGKHDHQAFVYREPTVCLVFYPHKTSAGHHHIRVRDQGSTDKKRAATLMRELDTSINSCTFHAKNTWHKS